MEKDIVFCFFFFISVFFCFVFAMVYLTMYIHVACLFHGAALHSTTSHFDEVSSVGGKRDNNLVAKICRVIE